MPIAVQRALWKRHPAALLSAFEVPCPAGSPPFRQALRPRTRPCLSPEDGSRE